MDSPKPQNLYLIQARYYDMTNNRCGEIAFAVGATGDDALATWRNSVDVEWTRQRRLYLDAKVTPVSMEGYNITLESIVK